MNQISGIIKFKKSDKFYLKKNLKKYYLKNHIFNRSFFQTTNKQRPVNETSRFWKPN